MKACFFLLGVFFGFGVSMLFLSYQSSRLPTDRENLATAILLRKDIAHIEAAHSQKNARDYAQWTSVYFSGRTAWGEVLPPVIQDATFTLRVRKQLYENVSLILEGTGKLPPKDKVSP